MKQVDGRRPAQPHRGGYRGAVMEFHLRRSRPVTLSMTMCEGEAYQAEAGAARRLRSVGALRGQGEPTKYQCHAHGPSIRSRFAGEAFMEYFARRRRRMKPALDAGFSFSMYRLRHRSGLDLPNTPATETASLIRRRDVSKSSEIYPSPAAHVASMSPT